MITRFLILILVFSVQVAQAKTETSFGYELSKDAYGALLLKSITDTSVAGMWLGITLYPPQTVRGSLKNKKPPEPQYYLYPLKLGHALTLIEIDPSMVGGSFEAALWKGKLPKTKCAKTDLQCKRVGYRLYGMRSYVWSQL